MITNSVKGKCAPFPLKRFKWLVSTIESGRRELDETTDPEDRALSVGGEHIGWQGEWKLEKPRYVSSQFFAKMPTGKIYKNDVLLVKDGATIGKVAIAERLPAAKSAVNEHVFLLRFAQPNSPKFYFYFLQSTLGQDQIWLEVRGSAQPGLNSEFQNVLVAPNPIPEVQRAVATFLDRETGKIDELIAKKERLIELLEEKRAALVTHAVTRGLNPDAPLRDSGIEWLGQIPAHWEVKRSKQVLIERNDRSTTGDEEMLTVSHITGVTPRSEKEVNMFEAETTEGYKLVSPNNLVINTLWAWMGAMGVARHEGIVSPAYHVYRIASDLLPKFVDYLVHIDAFKSEVTRFSKGVWSSRLRLYPHGLYEVILPIPPFHEQRAIAAHLKAEQERSAALQTMLRSSIKLLQERRSALITVAVTGKIDVRAAVSD